MCGSNTEFSTMIKDALTALDYGLTVTLTDGRYLRVFNNELYVSPDDLSLISSIEEMSPPKHQITSTIEELKWYVDQRVKLTEPVILAWLARKATKLKLDGRIGWDIEADGLEDGKPAYSISEINTVACGTPVKNLESDTTVPLYIAPNLNAMRVELFNYLKGKTFRQKCLILAKLNRLIIGIIPMPVVIIVNTLERYSHGQVPRAELYHTIDYIAEETGVSGEHLINWIVPNTDTAIAMFIDTLANVLTCATKVDVELATMFNEGFANDDPHGALDELRSVIIDAIMLDDIEGLSVEVENNT